MIDEVLINLNRELNLKIKCLFLIGFWMKFRFCRIKIVLKIIFVNQKVFVIINIKFEK